MDKFPTLTEEDSFYNVLRQRVADYLKTVGGPGPTSACIVLFWASFVAFWTSYVIMYMTGKWWSCLPLGFCMGLVGGFGHNWVHQPKYRLWASLSLDIVGLSSEGWYREHLLQHHMYTNTPLDNHWEGTAPFLIVNPLRERNWFQATVCPRI